MSDDRPSIAELQRLCATMTDGEWEAHIVSDEAESTPVVKHFEDGCAFTLVDIVSFEHRNANAEGIAALRNAAPVLLDIAAAALERRDAVDRSDWDATAEATDRLRAALARMRP